MAILTKGLLATIGVLVLALAFALLDSANAKRDLAQQREAYKTAFLHSLREVIARDKAAQEIQQETRQAAEIERNEIQQTAAASVERIRTVYVEVPQACVQATAAAYRWIDEEGAKAVAAANRVIP